ncbi:Zn-ribbon domain-containing OB-fold protein [Amycolatopsis sp. GM8]|uniref:Zn-ribbon domain-containing OB-fold protein n=1 Tax=Amycolatopsis sp. GM8 TaxID=2896530 RepID=UPI001F2DEF50|nr:OB-fold domain-containing protein [Amycolatopsis sp. GM8]
MTGLPLPDTSDPRPVPLPDEVSRFYWEGATAERLLVQRCRSCRQFQYPPDVCCVHCQGDDFDLTAVSGRGHLYSFTLVDRPLHEGFIDAVPYVVALVELVEQPGLLLLTNIVETQPNSELRCGMPVEVVFEKRGDIRVPQFRRTEADS